ncbi:MULTISPECIES: HlyD family efflux transporter periplasmic adaptor subunit [Mesorhizobium]|uniref:HlyD family secretion protein n=1 Tax=Mesorhizobium TaxID=68287 RepID=UPI0007FE954A|nr:MULTISPECIES: HlyD family efflux transporter periplasmic adaptor subunit [Mesorhizobium]MUT31316.1 HlyD family efflux transporter periplasmic adaptor subunit [Mesorhizobium japonicum]OBQ78159.1 hemolysin secretion protein D [Mesorhizobium sp. WSM3873]
MTIYKIIVLSVATALASLPFITITVSFQSAGIIRPTVEKTPLVAPVSGRISRILAAENDLVAQGQEILALDDGVVEEKLRALKGDIRAKSDFASDLETLISSGTQAKDPIRLLTESATAERAHFLNLVRENQYARENAAAELERAKRLLSAAVAPAKAVEEHAFALQNVELQGEILARRKFAEWNQQLFDVNLRLEELTAALHQLESERDLTLIRAPVSGALEQFSGLTSSSYVQAGQTVAWISPDGELVAEIFVSPNDIGFVRPGQSVRLQVDAFNYNQWGVIDATVLDVAHDFTLHDGTPAFKVRCALSRRHLALKHGLIGNLKKGMTVRARFLLGDSTVLELLYNEVDDWLNPLLASH